MHLDVHAQAHWRNNDDDNVSLLSPEVNVASVCHRKLFNDDAFSMECISDCKNNLLAILCGKMNDNRQGSVDE